MTRLSHQSWSVCLRNAGWRHQLNNSFLSRVPLHFLPPSLPSSPLSLFLHLSFSCFFSTPSSRRLFPSSSSSSLHSAERRDSCCCVLFFFSSFLAQSFTVYLKSPVVFLARRLRNLQVLIQLSVPGLGLRGEPEVGLNPIKTLLLSQHIRGDPTDRESEERKGQERKGGRGHVLWWSVAQPEEDHFLRDWRIHR